MTEISHLSSLRDFWRHFDLCRAAAHSDCCRLLLFCAVYKYSYLLTYLLTYFTSATDCLERLVSLMWLVECDVKLCSSTLTLEVINNAGKDCYLVYNAISGQWQACLYLALFLKYYHLVTKCELISWRQMIRRTVHAIRAHIIMVYWQFVSHCVLAIPDAVLFQILDLRKLAVTLFLACYHIGLSVADQLPINQPKSRLKRHKQDKHTSST